MSAKVLPEDLLVALFYKAGDLIYNEGCLSRILCEAAQAHPEALNHFLRPEQYHNCTPLHIALLNIGVCGSLRWEGLSFHFRVSGCVTGDYGALKYKWLPNHLKSIVDSVANKIRDLPG